MDAVLVPIVAAELDGVAGGTVANYVAGAAKLGTQLGKNLAWGAGFVPAMRFVNQGLTYLDDRHWFVPGSRRSST